MRTGAMAMVFAALAACGGSLTAASLQPGTACAHCRMTVIDPKLASQLVARGEEPRFFDDLGCLKAYLTGRSADPQSRAFVADHVTGSWIDAARAVYSRTATIDTPMGSHLVAHADDASRNADPAMREAARVDAAEIFGVAGAPGGTHDR